MGRRIIKFRNPHKPRVGASVFVVISAITAATAVFALAFVLIKFTGWTQPRPTYEGGPLRGVAMEDVLYRPAAADYFDAVIELKQGGSGHAYGGQKDVNFLEFSLSPRTGAKLSRVVFSLDGYARPYDVSGLQLYMNEKFLAEKPMFQGQANFDNLNINLKAGERVDFKVTGTVSNQAYAGDRVQIGIQDPGDITLRGTMGGSLSIGGGFPIWGPHVSVIGEMLR